AFTPERGRDGVGDARVSGEAEIVVRREIDGGATAGRHDGAATLAHRVRLASQVRVIEHREIAAEHGIERRLVERSRTRWHGSETIRLDNAGSSGLETQH